MFKQKLFGVRISPACAYCKHGQLMADGRSILCPHKGVTPPFEHCRKYRYDPLRRVPSGHADLPQYDSDEFTL